MFWYPSKDIKIGLRKILNNSTDIQQSFIQIFSFYKKARKNQNDHRSPISPKVHSTQTYSSHPSHYDTTKEETKNKLQHKMAWLSVDSDGIFASIVDALEGDNFGCSPRRPRNPIFILKNLNRVYFMMARDNNEPTYKLQLRSTRRDSTTDRPFIDSGHSTP